MLAIKHVCHFLPRLFCHLKKEYSASVFFFAFQGILGSASGAEFPVSLMSNRVGFTPRLLYSRNSRLLKKFDPSEDWLSSRCLTSVIALTLNVRTLKRLNRPMKKRRAYINIYIYKLQRKGPAKQPAGLGTGRYAPFAFWWSGDQSIEQISLLRPFLAPPILPLASGASSSSAWAAARRPRMRQDIKRLNLLNSMARLFLK